MITQRYIFSYWRPLHVFSRASALEFRVMYECRRHDTNRASICFVVLLFVGKVSPRWGFSTTTAKSMSVCTLVSGCVRRIVKKAVTRFNLVTAFFIKLLISGVVALLHEEEI